MVEKAGVSSSNVSWGWAAEWVASNPVAVSAFCNVVFATWGIKNIMVVNTWESYDSTCARNDQVKVNTNVVLASTGVVSAVFVASLVTSQNYKDSKPERFVEDVGVFLGTAIVPIMIARMMPTHATRLMPAIPLVAAVGEVLYVGYEIVFSDKYYNGDKQQPKDDNSGDDVASTVSTTQKPVTVITTVSTMEDDLEQDDKKDDNSGDDVVLIVSTTQKPVTTTIPVPQATTIIAPEVQKKPIEPLKDEIRTQIVQILINTKLDAQAITGVAQTVICGQHIDKESVAQDKGLGKSLMHNLYLRFVSVLNGVICSKSVTSDQIIILISRLRSLKGMDQDAKTAKVTEEIKSLVCGQHVEKESVLNSEELEELPNNVYILVKNSLNK